MLFFNLIFKLGLILAFYSYLKPAIPNLVSNSDTHSPVHYFQNQSIRINEIMADPSPSVRLPEVEYLELLNVGDHDIDLSHWTISDERTSAEFPNITIPANSYLLLCPAGTSQEFYPIDNLIEISPWPSLNNAEDHLNLKDSDGNVIDEVKYSDHWYQDSEKDQGGWSLEMIDPLNQCSVRENWIVSGSINGGTPGTPNEVLMNHSDHFGPQLVRVQALSPDSVLLTFNEPVRKDAAVTGIIKIEPFVSVSEMKVKVENQRELLVDLDQQLSGETTYTIEISNITDCYGNLSVANQETMEFGLPSGADSLDLVINEILFNPRTGGNDFIEFYNRSSKYLDIFDWSLITVVDSNINQVTINTHQVISPDAYLVLTDDKATILKEFPNANKDRVVEISKLPALPDDEASVILRNNYHQVIDSTYYSEKYHHPLLEDRNGVSLERVSPDHISWHPANWHSASAATGFASPGSGNSQYREMNMISSAIEITPPIFSPNHDGYNDFCQINFQFDNAGNIITAHIFDLHGLRIKNLAENYLSGVNGFLTWDGSTNQGTPAIPGYYLVYFEVIEADGSVNKFREKVVVAPDF